MPGPSIPNDEPLEVLALLCAFYQTLAPVQKSAELNNEHGHLEQEQKMIIMVLQAATQLSYNLICRVMFNGICSSGGSRVRDADKQCHLPLEQ